MLPNRTSMKPNDRMEEARSGGQRDGGSGSGSAGGTWRFRRAGGTRTASGERGEEIVVAKGGASSAAMPLPPAARGSKPRRPAGSGSSASASVPPPAGSSGSSASVPFLGEHCRFLLVLFRQQRHSPLRCARPLDVRRSSTSSSDSSDSSSLWRALPPRDRSPAPAPAAASPPPRNSPRLSFPAVPQISAGINSNNVTLNTTSSGPHTSPNASHPSTSSKYDRNPRSNASFVSGLMPPSSASGRGLPSLSSASGQTVDNSNSNSS
mmetsp:Transcript_6640/g.19638  ORF Transcript_6640/g.19638 Transcript_6640/m.19638 type:complete len:265 (+) Transcript_6640:175-969(+)